MKIHPIPRPPALLAAALFCLGSLAGTSSASTVVIGDTFSLDGDTRTAGSPLNGTTTETGGQTWTAAAPLVFAGDATNGYVTSTTNNQETLSVPFSFATYASYGNVATISTSIAYPAGNGQHLDIVFGNAGSGYSNHGILYLEITPSTNTWKLFTGTTSILSGSLAGTDGPIDSYSASTVYDYSLSYDQTDKVITNLTINGDTLVSDYAFTPISGTVSNVFITGFYAGANAMDLDALSVSMETVPEPGAWALLAGSVFLPVPHLWRKREAILSSLRA